MTDGQVKFQTLQETLRHNLAMEKNQGRELDISQQQADVAKENAAIKGREVSVKEAMLPYEQSLAQARVTNLGFQNAESATKTGKTILDTLTAPFREARDAFLKLFF